MTTHQLTDGFLNRLTIDVHTRQLAEDHTPARALILDFSRMEFSVNDETVLEIVYAERSGLTKTHGTEVARHSQATAMPPRRSQRQVRPAEGSCRPSTT